MKPFIIIISDQAMMERRRSGDLGGKPILNIAAGRNFACGSAASLADSISMELAGEGPQGDPPDEDAIRTGLPLQGELHNGDIAAHLKFSSKPGEAQQFSGGHEPHNRGTKATLSPSS